MFVEDLEPGMILDNDYLYLGMHELDNGNKMLRLIELNEPYWGELVRTFDEEDDFEISYPSSQYYDEIIETLLNRSVDVVKLANEVMRIWISEIKC